jgi:hypothetical protein
MSDWSDEQLVALRVVVTTDAGTRRAEVQLRGTRAVLVEDDAATPFETERLWPVVRDLLPDLDHVRADPRGAVAPRRQPGPTFVEDCVASVVVETSAAGEPTAVRSWLATGAELWEDTGSGVRGAAPGAIGDALIWDVTGAFERLVKAAS